MLPKIILLLEMIFSFAAQYASAWTPECTRASRFQGNNLLYGSPSELLEVTTPTTNDKDNRESNFANRTSSLYLFSLEWTPDDRISKPVRDLWKWKDATLGDGRDFFVPKPKTICALQEFCATHANLQECSILSNCARLEVLCLAECDPVQEISACFATQLQHSPSASSWQSVLTQKLDFPELVLHGDLPPDVASSDQCLELSRHWGRLEGVEAITHHLSLVSAGIAARPRRPDRETIFQPFSSRDAHVLLQLKRTKEVAMGTTVSRVLEFALRAGKAARNTEIVPELEQLRTYSKFSSEAPRALAQEVAQTAIDKAIAPLVEECVATVQAQEASGDIARLRREAEAMAADPSELKIVRSMLHQPTMDLRKGLPLNEKVLLEQIRKELSEKQRE